MSSAGITSATRVARRPLRCPVVDLKRSLNGALAGGVAAAVWAAQQPADKRAFDSGYDDVELLGKLVTRGDAWPVAGLALHVANGAVFGAVYAQLRPFLPGPPVGRARDHGADRARGAVAARPARRTATTPRARS